MNWETTIRTGSYESDQQALAQCDAHARAQGLTLRTTPLPGGGLHVAAVSPTPSYAPPGSPPGSPYGAAHSPYANPAPYGSPAPTPFTTPSPYAPPAAAVYGASSHGAAHHAGGGSCEQCGVRGPVKRCTFMQNIGMLVIRFPTTRQGDMCRRCIDQYFWTYTLVTGFLGWWGMISFIYSLVSIPTNIVNYVRAFGLPEAPRVAYDRVGVPTVAWPGWRIAALVLGVVSGLFSAGWTVAVMATIVDSAQEGSLNPGGVLILGLFMLVSWVVPVLMVVGAVKRPKIAAA